MDTNVVHFGIRKAQKFMFVSSEIFTWGNHFFPGVC